MSLQACYRNFSNDQAFVEGSTVALATIATMESVREKSWPAVVNALMFFLESIASLVEVFIRIPFGIVVGFILGMARIFQNPFSIYSLLAPFAAMFLTVSYGVQKSAYNCFASGILGLQTLFTDHMGAYDGIFPSWSQSLSSDDYSFRVEPFGARKPTQTS